ncbi:hypothetical protein, partial [Thiolapillus sp.]|uniref:hypothetical protein n=2 Tax=Thiolapillus sp. TaxID=2017437 RepID=UPI003AF969DE
MTRTAGWGTNRLSKTESILGTGMSQNLSRGRRHACGGVCQQSCVCRSNANRLAGCQDVKSVKWLNKNTRPFTDADDSEDYGNIDFFQLSSDGYHLSGD